MFPKLWIGRLKEIRKEDVSLCCCLHVMFVSYNPEWIWNLNLYCILDILFDPVFDSGHVGSATPVDNTTRRVGYRLGLTPGSYRNDSQHINHTFPFPPWKIIKNFPRDSIANSRSRTGASVIWHGTWVKGEKRGDQILSNFFFFFFSCPGFAGRSSTGSGSGVSGIRGIL